MATPESVPPAVSSVSSHSPKNRATSGCRMSTDCSRSSRACRCWRNRMPRRRCTVSSPTANDVMRQASAE